MTQILFKTYIDKDIKNWYDAIKSINYWVDRSKQIPPEILTLIQWNNQNEIYKILYPIISNYYNEEVKQFISNTNDRRNQYWNIILTKLEDAVSKPIPIDLITIYITTIGRCPYNTNDRSLLLYPYIKDDIKTPSQTIKTVVHEVLHMMLHYNYQEYILQSWLSQDEFHLLKESQTVILNQIFLDDLDELDQWYKSHEWLRNKFKIYRENNQNFEEFVDYGIEQVKLL